MVPWVQRGILVNSPEVAHWDILSGYVHLKRSKRPRLKASYGFLLALLVVPWRAKRVSGSCGQKGGQRLQPCAHAQIMITGCENMLKPNASKCMPHRTVQEKDPENYHDLILMESNNNDLLDPSLGIPWILRSTPPPIAPLVPHPHGSPHSADKRCSDELSPPQPWERVVPHLPEYLLETGTKSNMIGQWCNEVNFSFDGMRFTLEIFVSWFIVRGYPAPLPLVVFHSSGLGINHTLLYLGQVPCLCCATCIICCLKIPTHSCLYPQSILLINRSYFCRCFFYVFLHFLQIGHLGSCV